MIITPGPDDSKRKPLFLIRFRAAMRFEEAARALASAGLAFGTARRLIEVAEAWPRGQRPFRIIALASCVSDGFRLACAFLGPEHDDWDFDNEHLVVLGRIAASDDHFVAVPAETA